MDTFAGLSSAVLGAILAEIMFYRPVGQPVRMAGVAPGTIALPRCGPPQGVFYTVSEGELRPASEAVMKAALALIILYVATFLVAVQSSSQNIPAAEPAASRAQASAANKPAVIDPAKDADIRSLMELVGAQDTIDDAVNTGAEQFREHLVSSLPNSDRAQEFVNTFTEKYKARFNADEVSSQIVAAYDKHFTREEIKGLLQFYGSPLGQKAAAETPKIYREIQVLSRTESQQVAKEVLQQMKAENPDFGQSARIGDGPANNNGNGRRRWQRPATQQQAQHDPQAQ
jgi:hypothetical protein